MHFAFADGPGDARARSALHEMVTDLLADSGLRGDAYQLLDDGEEGLLVLMAPRADATPLLRATVEGLPRQLARLGGLRLRADFWQAEFRPDGGREQTFRADPRSVGAALDASGAQAIVALVDFLYYYVAYESGQADAVLAASTFRPLDDDTGWYHLAGTAGAAGAAASAGR